MAVVGELLERGNVIMDDGYLSYRSFVEANIYSVSLLNEAGEWKVVVFEKDEIPDFDFWDKQGVDEMRFTKGVVLQTRDNQTSSEPVERMHRIDGDKLDAWKKIDEALKRYPVGTELHGCFSCWVIGEPLNNYDTITIPVRYEDGSGQCHNIEYLDNEFKIVRKP